MNFATTKERIIQYIESKGFSVKEFLEKTEIKRGFLDSDKLKATVSDIFITKIIAKYPDINLEWLVTGRGEMLKNTYSLKPTTYQHDNIEDKNYMIEVQKKLIEKLEKEVKELQKQLENKTNV